MFKSQSFGRIFWVDDNDDFKSCPQNIDGTGDFANADYVTEWDDWEGVNYNKLFEIVSQLVSLKIKDVDEYYEKRMQLVA